MSHAMLPVLSSGSVLSLTSITAADADTKPVLKKSGSTAGSPVHRPSSAKSPTAKGCKKKRAVHTPDAPARPDLVQEVSSTESWVPMNRDATPGDRNWQYCARPVALEVARELVGKWPALEDTYIRTLKVVFEELRDEREEICQYFFVRR